ncbi:MAG TPA: type III pantothenate kinase [Bacteroidia bacterium]|nr:type III pantothenate kinase [Bacteroidia bacterium]
MNLIIDLGNTQTKVGIFSGKELLKKLVFDKNTVFDVKKILSEFPEIKNSIVSSVVNHNKEIINTLQNKTHCLSFDLNTQLFFKILYKTPETLGKDRIAAVAGAVALYPQKPLLVIDAGTCIKYNFITANAEFIGGAISPGIDMRYKALSTFTDRLPHLQFEQGFNEVIGISTKNSIVSGVQQGALFEIEGYIKHFTNEYKNGIVVATGGNLSFLVDGLKNSIFAAPDLILSGLNEILLYHHKN